MKFYATKKYMTKSGIELINAFILFKNSSIFSHTIEVDELSLEEINIEYSFSVYASEDAYKNNNEAIESFTMIKKYDESKSLEQCIVQCIDSI
ncbi:TPA: hypothetical protein R4219_003837 [Klebsiella pneumoniae]|nr:hypothetical protein [Klebsiella pneumoniae]